MKTMLSTYIVTFLLTVAVAKHHGQHHHKSHLMSHLVHMLRSNDNFFSELTKNAQKVVNGIFKSLHLSEVFSKEPKIKAILKMLYNLDDMAQRNFELYNVLRNASTVDVDNRPINQIRLNELIIAILNEKEVDMCNETEDGRSENIQSMPTKESSEFANSKEFKGFISRFIGKLRNLTVHDLFDSKENEKSDYKLDESGRRNLDVWEPSSEEIDMPNVKNRRIFRGKKTAIVSYPFVVSIHILNEFMCAGSIISRDLIITAASCLQLHHNNRFFRENPKTTFVRVGSDWTTRRGEKIFVLEIFFHPQYDPKTLNHNLAIVRLARNLYFQKRNRTKIKRILLDRGNGNLAANTAAIKILGWGAKKSSQIINEFEKLNYAVLSIYHIDECKEVYSKEFVTDTNFCAGFLSKGSGACNRDVGGPGIVDNMLVGVVSFGPPVCGAPDAPTVFTRVGHYINWIKRISEMRPVVYGVPTTSTKSDNFLIYFNTASTHTMPHMYPINRFLTSATFEPYIYETTEPYPILRADNIQDNPDDVAVLHQIVNDINNNKNEIIHDVINHDLHNDFHNMSKLGDKESKTEQPSDKTQFVEIDDQESFNNTTMPSSKVIQVKPRLYRSLPFVDFKSRDLQNEYDVYDGANNFE